MRGDGAIVMAKRKSKTLAGRGFWAKTPDGGIVHINGRHDMPEETLDAILRMCDLAYKNAMSKQKNEGK